MLLSLNDVSFSIRLTISQTYFDAVRTLTRLYSALSLLKLPNFEYAVSQSDRIEMN